MPVLTKGTAAKIDRLVQNAKREIRTETDRLRREKRLLAEERASRARALLKLEREEERIRTRRLPLAVEGILSLLALSAHPKIRTLYKIQEGKFVFYNASRPSGLAWENRDENTGATRDVQIILSADGVRILYGASYVADEMEAVNIPTGSTRAVCTEILLESVLSFSKERLDALLALNPEQERDEWLPYELAEQVLVECADSNKFNRFLHKALGS